MKVSNEYLELSKIENNNLKHKITIFNITKNKDITIDYENNSISINRNIKENGSISPNSVNLSFLFNDWLDFGIEKNDIVKIVDTFNNEDLTIFKGLVDEIRFIEDFNNKKIANVIIKDLSIKGYELKFTNDDNYQDIYYYKNSNKENSILYILAKKIGFSDEDIEIQEITYSNGEYIKIPSINLKKGETIIKELIYLVQSIVGNIFVSSDGKLKITSILNQNDTNIINYELNEKNILDSFEMETITAKYNKIEIKYNEYIQESRQPIFILYGQNANYEEDNANINIKANINENDVTSYWNIKYITDDVANIDDNIEVKAYYFSNEEKIYIENFNDYRLDFENKKLKLWNSNKFEVFIEKFKIYGQPIRIVKDNLVSYTEKELNDNNINLLTINNKYISTHQLAREISKYKYNQNCKDLQFFNLTTNSLPFLELEDVLTLNFRGYNKRLQIVSITQFNDKTKLKCVEYKEIKKGFNIFETYKNNLYDKERALNSNIGGITLDKTTPPSPLNFEVVSDILGVRLTWNEPKYNNIKGYYILIKEPNGDDGEFTIYNKIFVGNVTNYFLNLRVGQYKFSVITVNNQGIESIPSNEIIANSMLLSANEVALRDLLDRNTLIVDEVNRIKLGMVYGNNISPKAITGDKVQADSLSINHINFGNNSGIRKDYKFDDNGIVLDTDGNPVYNSSKLIIDGNIQFSNNVNIRGQITGENSLLVGTEEEGKQVILRNGLILFREKNPENNEWTETRVIKKEKNGLYTYNPKNPEWIDVRDYPSQVWNGVNIKSAITGFSLSEGSNSVVCEVVRDPANIHRFYIKVGTSEDIILTQNSQSYEIDFEYRNLTENTPFYTEIKNFTSSLYTQIIVFSLESITETYKFQRDLTAKELGLSPLRNNASYSERTRYYTKLSELQSLHGPYVYKFERVYKIKNEIRYKEVNSTWSEWKEVNSLDLSDTRKTYYFQLRHKIVYNETTLTEGKEGMYGFGGNLDTRLSSDEELESYHRKRDLTFSKTSTIKTIKVNLTNRRKNFSTGGQALWIATEE